MAKTIPVIIYHETGEKAQSGGKKNQEYVKYCVAQAERFNEKVILMGDEYNKAWASNWYNANDFVSEQWEEFLSVFENLSPYPQAWAEGIFKRFFLIREYLEHSDYTDCVLIDSDVFLYFNVSEYEPFTHCRFAAECPKDQDIPVLWKGNGFKWVICPGLTYITQEALIEFTDFCIDMYKNHRDILMEKWEIHQKYQIYGGLNEMSLLYLWMKTLPEEDFLNLLIEDKNHAVSDYSVAFTNGYLLNQYEMNRSLGVKKLDWKDGIPYCHTIDGHKETQLLCLHFGDITKIFMEGIYKKHTYTIDAKLFICLLKLRGRLADIKHGNTKFQQRLKLKHSANAGNQ